MTAQSGSQTPTVSVQNAAPNKVKVTVTVESEPEKGAQDASQAESKASVKKPAGTKQLLMETESDGRPSPKGSQLTEQAQ